ncbi:triose-phosphate transporter family-domain-containing protein [Pyronema omphalodes]|nr:triose-phosphate transporter family-domain-containing protein [Pyronema omphalodes]
MSSEHREHLLPSISTPQKDGRSTTTAPENESVRTKYAWLALYFSLNLALTLYNKFVMTKFPFPYLLTGVHALCGTLGCAFFYSRGAFTLTRLTDRENLTLVLFSFLYTINIAISNVSLNLVTIPFHQIVRAMTPFFTVIIYRLFFGKTYSRATYTSLIPVVAGVGFATAGDYYFTALGFLLTLFGAFLAALLYRMSPLAFLQTLIWAYITGEFSAISGWAETSMTQKDLGNLLINGLIAFALNVISFTANKKTGALTMTVAANVKQILTIVLSVLFWNLKATGLNTFGIVMTLCGGAWYA